MIEKVGEEAKKLGKRALVVTGGKSARRMGALQRVEDSLKKMGVKTFLFEGVEANPSLETIKRGTNLTKEEKEIAISEANSYFNLAKKYVNNFSLMIIK